MTIRHLLLILIAVFLIAGITMAQGPKKDSRQKCATSSGAALIEGY